MEPLDEYCKSLLEEADAEEEELLNKRSEMKHVDEDWISLLEQVNTEDKELKNKRRWLLGLQTFEDDDEHKGVHEDNDEGDEDEDEEGDEDEEDVKGSSVEIKRHPIPESLLREDDVLYETIKSLVEKEACNSKNIYHISEDEMQLVHSPRDVRGVLHLIKDMTNQGLDRFAEALTGGSVKYEKTRWKMIQTIKRHLLSSSLNKRQKIKLSENQSAVLKNPHNYHWSRESRFVPADSASYRAAVYKILGALEALPTQTLSSMHRKMKGVEGYTPRLIPPKKSGWGRDTLIKHLRKKSLKLLSKLKDGDPLQEPLAKAMDVAGLHLKLIQGCEFATNFVIQPSPVTNSLQNDIAKCIKLLDQRVELRVLKEVQRVLNTSGKKIADRSLRALVRNLLTEYLCECSDMEVVPECLHQVLAIIKKSCKAPIFNPEKMKIEEDVESILSVSASMKQLVWDLIPPSEDEKLDQEFADAYMEDLEDSYDDDDDDNDDDGDDDDDDDYDDDEVNMPSAVNLSQRMHLMRHHMVTMKNTRQEEGCRVMFDDERSVCKDSMYLAVQDATDEASMVAYRLINHILSIEKGSDEPALGVEEGNDKQKKRKARNEAQEEEDDGAGSLVLKAVEELLPSFAKKCERLKKLK